MTPSGPGLVTFYAQRLREHAHLLIAAGYRRMDKAAFASEQEPAITGELVREMRAFLESQDAATPRWVCYYSIHDDPPVSGGGTLGKARPRVDIEFERVTLGPRPRLSFEAKRLDSRTGQTVAGYLGEDGLGCFLSGRYPMPHGEAGMLGYVQTDDEATWAAKIADALHRNGATHPVVAPPFGPHRVCASLSFTYISHHKAAGHAAPIAIHHVLLSFASATKGKPLSCCS